MSRQRFDRLLFLLDQQRLILIACAVTAIGLGLTILILATDLLFSHLSIPVVTGSPVHIGSSCGVAIAGVRPDRPTT